MDNLASEARSRLMAAIRRRDTKPELLLRHLLHKRGFRFRVDVRDLPGRPDLKLTRYRAVVFVNGCFWHGHACTFFRLPRSRETFWRDKIEENRLRDLYTVRELRKLGWRVCVVWECSFRSARGRRDPGKIAGAVASWLAGSGPFLEIFDQKATSVGIDALKALVYSRCSYGRNESLKAFASKRESLRYDTGRIPT